MCTVKMKLQLKEMINGNGNGNKNRKRKLLSVSSKPVKRTWSLKLLSNSAWVMLTSTGTDTGNYLYWRLHSRLHLLLPLRLSQLTLTCHLLLWLHWLLHSLVQDYFCFFHFTSRSSSDRLRDHFSLRIMFWWSCQLYWAMVFPWK